MSTVYAASVARWTDLYINTLVNWSYIIIKLYSTNTSNLQQLIIEKK